MVLYRKLDCLFFLLLGGYIMGKAWGGGGGGSSSGLGGSFACSHLKP